MLKLHSIKVNFLILLGKIDDDTAQLLSTEGCGVPDVIPDTPDSTRQKRQLGPILAIFRRKSFSKSTKYQCFRSLTVRNLKMQDRKTPET